MHFFLASALAWGGAAMHLRCHCFWRFSRPAPLLGKHIITEFIFVLFVSIKAAMDLLSRAILLQLKCVYFYCPVNRAQARAAFMGFVLGGEKKTNTERTKGSLGAGRSTQCKRRKVFLLSDSILKNLQGRKM